jgi:hypothetical protein
LTEDDQILGDIVAYIYFRGAHGQVVCPVDSCDRTRDGQCVFPFVYQSDSYVCSPY